jgi:hypothetical protein
MFSFVWASRWQPCRIAVSKGGNPMTAIAPRRFQYVQEGDNAFLAIFPHRFDYIYAHHANPGDTPDWLTESRHPLSDRLIQQGGYLYGVRFGAQTQYALLDIDLNSRYHPNQDPHAIRRILDALEPLGLVTSLNCTSSYSGGLHLYLPFTESQSSWKLAIALSCLLENAGFKLLPGQLEVFPNPKPYIVEGAPSLFNAHRLPLQAGSYLLNSDFETIRSSPEQFVEQWQWAQQKNCLDEKTLKRIIQQAKRRCFRISGKADKFINDLNAEIEPGWTNFGQTNYLLGRITMREYIFHHILEGGTPLEGEKLVEAIVTTAQALPGFNEYCRHRHELEHRVEEWVRCIEKSHYFRYGDTKGKFKSKLDSTEIEPAIKGLPTWNQQQSTAARERIRSAIGQLLETNVLPTGATSRFKALTQAGIGGGSLYRHRDLWHPEFLNSAPPVENPPDPPTSLENSQLDRASGASNWHIPSSLLSSADGNSLSDKGLSDRVEEVLEGEGSNASEPVNFSAGSGVIQSMLFDVQAWLAASKEATREANEQALRIRGEAQQQAHVDRMQQFLASGDPILVAEAIAWAEINPGALDERSLVAITLNKAAQVFWASLRQFLPRIQWMLWAHSWQLDLDESWL